jgi:hypothetical protein
MRERKKPYRPKKGEKEVVISFAVSVEEEASNEDIATRLEGAITSLGENVRSVSDVQVRTVPRVMAAAPGDGGGGYETRLWEKVTCDFLGGRLQNPGDPVELQDEISQLSEAVAQLGKQVQKLGRSADR